MANKCSLLWLFIRFYWKTLFLIIYPALLLPLIILHNERPWRCLYVILIMAGFWVFEILPLPITSLIPMLLFPLMGIMGSDVTSLCYLKETNMMFLTGLIIAVAIEYCNLHTRIALYVIRFVGCSPRRLNIGLVTVTMLISMWISNTAATAMMVPIIAAILTELEDKGIGYMYEPLPDGEPPPDLSDRKPTRVTICYFISVAYASSIGGSGTIVGSGTNLTFRGIYETTFPNSPGIEFTKWSMFNIPVMLIIMFFSTIWLQIIFMGLFRPKSEDAQRINIGKEGEIVAKNLINQRLIDLGPMTFHEIAVAILFVVTVLLWFFRKPEIITGWAELITSTKVKDSTAAFLAIMLMFMIPAQPNFIYIFSKNETKRPKEPSVALLTWKIIQQKLNWGVIFLLGGGFAIAEGSKQSGMSKLLAKNLQKITIMPRFVMQIFACCLGAFLTQFSSNSSTANILLPILGEVASVSEIHPLFLMLPTTLCCSFSYCLPVSTPPNAIVAGAANVPSVEFVKAGLGVLLISMVVMITMFPLLGEVIWEFGTFPEWAAANRTNDTKL